MNQLIIKKKNELTTNKKKGFTLVELIIVIAIIAILSAIAMPKFGAIKTQANINADISIAKSIHTAISAKVANGDPGYITDGDIASATVSTLIDGNNKAKATANGIFSANISSGNVIVSVGTGNDGQTGKVQVYPRVSSVSGNIYSE